MLTRCNDFANEECPSNDIIRSSIQYQDSRKHANSPTKLHDASSTYQSVTFLIRAVNVSVHVGTPSADLWRLLTRSLQSMLTTDGRRRRM